LKALEQEFTGRIKCVYIDPPYNSGSAFEHYDDGLEHSLWLSLMRDRLELLWKLLAPEGTIWITIDDHEAHYLKVLCDEVFGRRAFVASVVWENFYGRSNAAAISPAHNYLLVYSPLGTDWKNVRNLLSRTEKGRGKYKNPDSDPRGPWRLGPIFAPEERHEGLMYTITTPSGRKVSPPKGSHWRMPEDEFWSLVKDGRIVFGAAGNNVPAMKLYLNEVQDGLVPRSWWPHDEVGHTQEAKREVQALFPDTVPFATPKPERLLHTVIEISTNPGEWVLDSFLGSGTTAAVAHKMRRRWIGVELGDHAITHCMPRLKKVADGADDGGITPNVGWKGGGGFRFFRLAPSLLSRDKWGNWIVSKNYHPEMLAEAMCKLEGFQYAPDPEVFWVHGKSTESDFIYVTTQNLSRDQLLFISDQVGPERTLLICCSAFRAKKDDFPNLTLKKIPQAVLSRCEWGRDDYSLNVEELAPVQIVEEAKAEISDDNSNANEGGKKPKTGGRRRKGSAMQDLPLFAGFDNGGDRK
jgi:adenine-specific DNA-methyltransferase